jgi:hypothetical protein
LSFKFPNPGRLDGITSNSKKVYALNTWERRRGKKWGTWRSRQMPHNMNTSSRTHAHIWSFFPFRFLLYSHILCCDEDFIWHLFVEPS